MSDQDKEVVNGEQEAIVDEKPAFGPDDVQRMIAEAVGDTNKKWQSRFDQILSEKKATESKALTVEERLAQIEAERQSERISWARKEAKAKAGIDEDFEVAALAYASNDPEKISEAADRFKAYWDAKESEYKKQIAELQQHVQYGNKKPPVGSSNSGANSMKMSDYRNLSGKEQADFMKGGGVLLED
jgi:hypothetical protein